MANEADDTNSELSDTEHERQLVAALRCGNEAAFTTLIERYHMMLIRLALPLVGSRAIAEDVVQETWLGVVQGIERFEGRSLLKTWISRILLNRARTRAAREGRTLTFSALAAAESDTRESAVDPDAFIAPGQAYAGWWRQHPTDWQTLPEDALLARETRAEIEHTIATLPPAQQTVITLRDIEGWSAAEVCRVLEISETYQRVLLHRARTRVRKMLEALFDMPE